MELQIGNLNNLIVKKETDIAYTLYPEDSKETEVFMHFNQATRRLMIGESIEVFLYYDNKRRLCATMESPLATTTKAGFGKVVSVNERLGCFLNIGIAKDILLSVDDLPRTLSGWPQVGEELPIILHEKKNTLTAKLISKQDITEPHLLKVKDQVEAYVTGFTTAGLNCVTKDFDFIYIHKSLTRSRFHLGELINPHIVNINENNEYNGSLIEQKEKMMHTDADALVEYMDHMGGVIPLGDKSTPEEIFKIFKMSKGAFKRAVGTLYKDHLIKIEDNRIIKIEKQ